MKGAYIKRKFDDELLAWSKETSYRKPLLLRGARQVGKSSVVRHLAKQFKYFVEINFELDENARDLFANTELYPEKLCRKIFSMYDIPIIPGKTLLFLDEIQASLRAITSLRYFYEKYPELHVVAAGSLLEFALEELPSFGVGRISFMYIYPMNFFEFLEACGKTQLLQEIKEANPQNPLLAPIHKVIVEQFRMFLILGGMPEVVSAFINSGDLLKCQRILDNLIAAFRADFAKYKQKVPALQISTVFDAVVTQMGKKFVYSNISQEYTHRQLKESLKLLIMSGLVIPVTHSFANGLPLGAEIDIKKQKMLLLDTGIFQRLLGLPIADILIYNDFDVINKGCIAELLAGLEILKSGSCHTQKSLYYWHRENKSSNAEVDYVVQIGQDIVPIEVKSSKSGAMQSMRLFLEEKKSNYGIRSSLENFGEMQNIKIIPIYAIGGIFDS